MIVFDSNVLFGLSPDAPKFDLLRALKRSGHHKVGIPWMVLEEIVAQKVLAEAEAHQRATAAVGELNRLAPRRKQPKLLPFDPEEAKDYWRLQYQQLFEVIETSGEAARQALAREAYREKPAKGTDAKDKGGARDAAIWLSAVDYLKQHPDEHVHFVSANTRDFGNGELLPERMATDLRGFEDRLVVLTSFEEMVTEFTTPLDIDEKHVEDVLVNLLASEEALTPLESTIKETLAATADSWVGNEVNSFFAGLTPNSYAPVRWTSWLSPPRAILREVHEASGHRIGNEEWYSATVDWLLVGLAARPSSNLLNMPTALPGSSGFIACQLRTRLLFSSRSGETPTVLKFERPTILDPGERASWEPEVLKALRTTGNTTAAAVTAILLAALGFAAIAKGKGNGLTDQPDE